LFRLGLSSAPPPDGIEAFQAETERIDLLMTLRADLVRPVFGQTVTHGGGTGDIGFDRGNVIRRRRRMDAEMFSLTHTPRVTGEVSTPFALTVSTLAMPSRPPRCASPAKLTFLKPSARRRSFLFRQVVKLGEFLVDEVWSASRNCRRGSIVCEEVAEKETRLRPHRGGQIFGVIRAVGLPRRWLAAEVAEVQPTVEEAVHEGRDAVIGIMR